MTTEYLIHENLNFLHILFQELEDRNIELPMGDYGIAYEMLESARDYFADNQEEN